MLWFIFESYYSQKFPPVRISGASGAFASRINGIYEPTSPPEFHAGQLTYRKLGDDDTWLEYVKRPFDLFPSTLCNSNEWQVKPTSAKGVDLAMARLQLDPHPVVMCDERFGVVGTI
jgi:hypothetical protein